MRFAIITFLATSKSTLATCLLPLPMARKMKGKETPFISFPFLLAKLGLLRARKDHRQRKKQRR